MNSKAAHGAKHGAAKQQQHAAEKGFPSAKGLRIMGGKATDDVLNRTVSHPLRTEDTGILQDMYEICRMEVMDLYSLEEADISILISF